MPFVPPEIYIFIRLIFHSSCGIQFPLKLGCPRGKTKLHEPKPVHESSRVAYADLLNLADERVMQELRDGNADAFAVVFKRYRRLVHVTALRILRDAAEAEDTTQAVFLEIYRKSGQFDPARGTLKVWLLQYAYARSISRRNYLLVRQYRNHVDVSEAEQANTVWSPARIPFQEATRLTAEILAALPTEQRETIEMFFFQGLTLKEIAERRNESFSNVRHHYYRGLERLRKYVEDGVQAKDASRGALRLEWER